MAETPPVQPPAPATFNLTPDLPPTPTSADRAMGAAVATAAAHGLGSICHKAPHEFEGEPGLRWVEADELQLWAIGRSFLRYKAATDALPFLEETHRRAADALAQMQDEQKQASDALAILTKQSVAAAK